MKNPIYLVPILAFFLFSCSGEKSAKRDRTATENEVEKVISEFEINLANSVGEDNIGSTSVSVFFGDKIVWSKAFGLANRDKKIQADTNTIYRTASISKTITAYLMMLLDRKS